jgi:protease II
VPTRPPPITRRDNLKDIIHGVEVPDPYRWLEDGESPETRVWIAAQQAYAAPFFQTPGRERIRNRLAELTKIDALGIPFERSGYYFFARRSADDQRAVISRRCGLYGADEVIVDANSMSTDHMPGVHIVSVSRDGSLMLYGVRQGGEDEFEIRTMEVGRAAICPIACPERDTTARHGSTIGAASSTRHASVGLRESGSIASEPAWQTTVKFSGQVWGKIAGRQRLSRSTGGIF